MNALCAKCGMLTPCLCMRKPDAPRGDMVKAAAMAAGVAERALERTQRAEEVVEAARKLLTIPNGSMARGRAVRALRDALAAFDRAKAAS